MQSHLSAHSFHTICNTEKEGQIIVNVGIVCTCGYACCQKRLTFDLKTEVAESEKTKSTQIIAIQITIVPQT